jgi:hypothetical protein
MLLRNWPLKKTNDEVARQAIGRRVVATPRGPKIAGDRYM